MIAWAIASLVGAGLVVAFVKLGRYEPPRFQVEWAAWAEGRGELAPSTNGLQVELTVGHVPVLASVGWGRSTSFRALWVLAAGPPFELADPLAARSEPDREWTAFALPDATLDARFVRRARTPGQVANAFDHTACAWLSKLPSPLSLHSTMDAVVLTLRGVVSERAVLDAAVELVAHIASHDIDAVLAVLRALPGAEVLLPEQLEGLRLPLRAVLPERAVTLSYTSARGRRVTTATAALPAEHPSGWFHIDAEGQPDPVLETSQLPPAVLPLLSTLGESVLRFGAGRIELSMDGAVLDSVRLLAAADVCAAIATAGTAGAFR